MCKFRTLRADEIDCRVAQINQKGLSLLLYKDARCDMNILDETVGSLNWTRRHTRDNANCVVSIYDPEKKEWVSKEDTGTESNTEAEKGLASDSFKRACFNWGIGRELYTAPFIYINSEKAHIEQNDKGRWMTYDKFEVADIAYDDKRCIKSLRIVNAKSKAVVFSMGYTESKKPETAPKKEAEPVHINPVQSVICECCGQPITDYKGKNAKELEIYSVAHFGQRLCGKCIVKAAKYANS